MFIGDPILAMDVINVEPLGGTANHALPAQFGEETFARLLGPEVGVSSGGSVHAFWGAIGGEIREGAGRFPGARCVDDRRAAKASSCGGLGAVKKPPFPRW